MARPEDLLEQLRPHLLTLDDDALAIASSKGLVRRAHKELAKAAAPPLCKAATMISPLPGPTTPSPFPSATPWQPPAPAPPPTAAATF
jgi:hypothetical protein